MAVTFMTFFTVAVRVSAEEPEDSDDYTTKKNKEHLQPLELTSVEFCDDDFTASDVDESTT